MAQKTGDQGRLGVRPEDYAWLNPRDTRKLEALLHDLSATGSGIEASIVVEMIATEMVNLGLREFRGRRFRDYLVVRPRPERVADAERWLNAKTTYVASGGRSDRGRDLGKWFENIGEEPPEHLFESEIRWGIGKRKS